jgi:hypothetical protein
VQLLFMLLRTDNNPSASPPVEESVEEPLVAVEAEEVEAGTPGPEAEGAAGARPLHLRTLTELTPSITAIPIMQLDDLVSGSRCVHGK